MIENLLNMNIWYGPRLMDITGVKLEKVTTPEYGSSDKLIFSIKDKCGKPFNVSNVWIKDKDGTINVRGLWFINEEYGNNNYINADSNIAKTLEYYSCTSIGELIGKTVEVLPDTNNFLTLVATKMD